MLISLKKNPQNSNYLYSLQKIRSCVTTAIYKKQSLALNIRLHYVLADIE